MRYKSSQHCPRPKASHILIASDTAPHTADCTWASTRAAFSNLFSDHLTSNSCLKIISSAFNCRVVRSNIIKLFKNFFNRICTVIIIMMKIIEVLKNYNNTFAWSDLIVSGVVMFISISLLILIFVSSTLQPSTAPQSHIAKRAR